MLSRLLSLTAVAAIAHRGGSKLRPENTIAAFDRAVALGVDGLECDVHLSRDGVVVVIHDPTLDRTTDATGPVAARSAAELARVDAGFSFGAADGFPFRGRGFGVPRLSDLLDRYRGLPLVIEVKGSRPEVAERAVETVRRAGAADRVILAGFSDAVLSAARRLAPGVVTSASIEEVRSAMMRSRVWMRPRRPQYRLFQVPYRLRGREALDRRFVRVARRAGLPVEAWVIDAPDDMRRLIGWGVSGIISDRPDVAIDVIRAGGKGPSGPSGSPPLQAAP
jgi:glycerophosphoryl diester phosphodiesterase